MKRAVLAVVLSVAAFGGTAWAADLPPAAPAPRAPATYVPVAAAYTWTGIYLGINAGYEFGSISPSGFSSFNSNGFLAGATVGGNYQFGSFVIGIEADGDYNSASGTLPTAGNSYKSDWLATVRGRAGYAWDRVLLYATGGGAFAPASVGGNANFAGGSTTMGGFTGGGGIEAAFAPGWSAKAEYLYVDFPNPSIAGATFKATENVIRAGINYKFTWW